MKHYMLDILYDIIEFDASDDAQAREQAERKVRDEKHDDDWTLYHVVHRYDSNAEKSQ